MANQSIRRLNISGPDGSQIYELPPGKTIIGRQAGIDVRLDNPMISRRHTEVECTSKACLITDLGSANGSTVNGERLEPNAPRTLAPGDVIELGPFRLAYEQIVLAAPSPKPAKKKAAAPKKKPAQPKKPAAKPAAKKETPPPPPPPKPPRPTRADRPKPEPDYSQPPPGLAFESRRFLEYLPGIYHTDFMTRFLAIFEAIFMPAEWNINNFDIFLDPRTAPEDFLPWLANWFSISFDPSWSIEQRRTLLTEAHQIYAKRGTRWSLARVLEIYTGSQPEILDLQEGQDPFTFTVKIPISEKDLDRTLIETIIDASKPAHTNYSLQFKATRTGAKKS
jgi:phage tail-like protein